MKVRYRLVYCPRGVFRGDGRAMVYVEASQYGKRMYFGSNVYVLPNQWDRRRMMVVDYPNADALNAYLFEMVVNLEKVELDLWKRGITPTLHQIRENSVGECDRSVSFRSFCESAIRDSARRESTKKNMRGTLKCLFDFSPGCSWVDVSSVFVQQFQLWLINKGYARNTVMKHLRNLRTLVNEAIVAGYMSSGKNPFKVFKLTHKRSVHRFLSPDELRRLEDVDVAGRQAHIKDAFLFCCYTGLRYSDFRLLKQECLVEEGGCKWLVLNQKKTGNEVRIPLSLLFGGKGNEIIVRYDSLDAFSRITSNSKVNATLKVLQEKSGIKTHMTFHTARHTCATLLCYQGVPITTVQKILGHSAISTTQIYQEVMPETMINDLKRVRL